MKINDIETKLPKTEESLRNFFQNCRNRKKLIPDTEGHYKKHLLKAKHDLSRAIAEFEDECWDWTIVKAYYSTHHAANAMLSKEKGLFSKDHYCLIVALKYWNLVDSSLFEELVDMHEKFADVFSLDITFQLRKLSQYDIDEWEHLTKEDAELTLNFAKKFIKFVEETL